jgi:hypothetical protein
MSNLRADAPVFSPSDDSQHAVLGREATPAARRTTPHHAALEQSQQALQDQAALEGGRRVRAGDKPSKAVRQQERMARAAASKQAGVSMRPSRFALAHPKSKYSTQPHTARSFVDSAATEASNHPAGYVAPNESAPHPASELEATAKAYDPGAPLASFR